MFDAQRGGGLLSVYWLARLREHGAVLVLDGTPWAAIWRCAQGEPVARTWRGPTAIAREAIRGGAVEYRGTLRNHWALYTISKQGEQAHHAWSAERARLRETIRELRAKLAEAERIPAFDPAADAVDDQRIAGLEPFHAELVRRIQSARGKVVPVSALHQSIKVAQVQICRLRRLRPDIGAQIETVWGVGYRWKGE